MWKNIWREASRWQEPEGGSAGPATWTKAHHAQQKIRISRNCGDAPGYCRRIYSSRVRSLFWRVSSDASILGAEALQARHHIRKVRRCEISKQPRESVENEPAWIENPDNSRCCPLQEAAVSRMIIIPVAKRRCTTFPDDAQQGFIRK
jgi:hypothetical protein